MAVVAEPRDGGAASRLADDAVFVPDAGGVGRWWRHHYYCFVVDRTFSRVVSYAHSRPVFRRRSQGVL